MTARPRLLFLSQALPFPPHAGVAGRTYNVLRQLARDWDIDLVPFFHLNHHPDPAARVAARRALEAAVDWVAEPVPIASEHAVTRKLWDHARSLLTARAYTYYLYESGAFDRALRARLRQRPPQLVHIDSLDLHRWIGALPRVPIACTHHNIESELLRRMAARIDPVFVRPYVWLQALRVEALEQAWCPDLALNVMTSRDDADKLRALAPGARTAVVPNGTDTTYYRPAGDTPAPGRVAFVGPTYSYPNRDAVEFLLARIWPRVRAASAGASLELIGRGARADLARYAATPGVRAPGHVPDIRPHLAEAACCVVPIRIGGGTRLKILDAWAMGKAVVSTTVGCEGLEAVDGENILIRDDPHAFADAVADVLGNPGLRLQLESNARRTAVGIYDWSVVGRVIREAYRELLGAAAPPVTRGVRARLGELLRV